MKSKILTIFSVLFIFSKSFSAVICGDTGAVYDDINLCQSSCSSPCSTAVLRQTGSSGVCDKNNYQGFVYYNGKTYALTKNVGFWEDFNNLVVITDQQTNDLLAKILSYYNTTAWIGLYDPNKSKDYNSINPDRFIWKDGTPVSYTNWANGEPNNALPNEDIGVVPIYGEHWGQMYQNGTWNDIGYHKYFGGDYKPKFYALVEWNGALDCVNAVYQDNNSSSTNLTDILCDGKTPCYACTIDGTDFKLCNAGTNPSNQTAYSCPINRQQCTATYENPVCPSGSTLNTYLGVCVLPVVIKPVSFLRTSTNFLTYGYGRFYISAGGNTLNIKYNYSYGSSSFKATDVNNSIEFRPFYISLTGGGTNNAYLFEGKGSYIELKKYICALWYCYPGSKISTIYLSKGKAYGKFILMALGYNGFTIKAQNNQICDATNCLTFSAGVSCPSGFTYNLSRNICEANPICQNGTYDANLKKCYVGDFNCPLGSYDCIKLSDGNRYCTNIPCGDVSNYSSTFEDTDTQQGANDKEPDGEIDENGNCLGTIYIFNGQDKRCRPPGTQTAFNDCCKKGEITLLGLVNLGKCNADEQYLAKLREWGDRDGKCHYIGEYCAEEWKLGFTKICVQKKKTFCCFSSPLARIIQEQGRQQLGISWGDPKAPNCRGFTPEEFQKIDWSKIDFSEWINNEVIPNIQQNLNNTLTNTIDQIKSNIQNKY